MNKTEEPAIIVKDVKKSFRIPLDKTSGIKQLFVNIFKRKKGYREFTALDGVSFEIKKGEFFGIVGRNGSGKSTLLKILAGVYTPDSGGVAVNGSLTPFIELGVGFNPELSGRENVFLNGALLGFSRQEMEAMYSEIVDFAELHDFMEERLKNYSSGMQVRLAFSIAIRANTDILVLDEVLAVGDANFQKKCYDYFRNLKEDRKTVILVSHDMEAVKKFCNKALLIENGKTISVGDPEDVGNEYVLRNIEKRHAVTESKKKEEDKTQSSPVHITDVVVLDGEGRPVHELLSGQSLNISVAYSVHEKVKGVNIGVGVHSDKGQIFGYNTQMDDIDVPIKKKGRLTLQFANFPALGGDYWISVTCFGLDEVDMYDTKLRITSLRINAVGKTQHYRGLVYIPHQWEV